MQTDALSGGFANAPIDAAHAFRHIMQVMAQPGRIETVAGGTAPAPLSQAAGIVLLTLCDPETPVFLAPSRDTKAVRDWITFHTGAPFCSPGDAHFAAGTWDELTGLPFPIGTAEYPDRSTTLIVECDALSDEGATLRGPGIKDTATLSLPEVAAFQANARLFPLGLDHFLTAGAQIAALPRTTKVS
jgi:alpha-D-ribose 1-methylphosphonate 5-triphosphate synthase subunit PhnH